MNGMREVVERSMWRKSEADGWNGLGGAGVLAKFEHRDVLGSTRNKTLILENRADALGYEIIVASTHAGDDALAMVDSGEAPFSSWGMMVFEDDFKWDSGVMVRHLISGLLTDVTVTSQPAYPSTEAVCRSLASQFGEDECDVIDLAKQGELRRLFVRTDSPAPAPAMVAETRSEPAESDSSASDPGAKLVELYQRRLYWNAPPMDEIDIMRARLASRKRKMQMDEDAAYMERRSLMPPARPRNRVARRSTTRDGRHRPCRHRCPRRADAGDGAAPQS
jgi:phage head maturation protease